MASNVWPDPAERIAELEAMLGCALDHLGNALYFIEWQPIETAPKDETDILVTNAAVEGGFPQVVFWNTDPNMETYPWAVNDGSSYHAEAFTHWMRLPPAPLSALKDKAG